MQKYFYLGIFLVALGSCICFSVTEGRAADISSSDSVNTALSQLEDKYFEHQYDADSDVDRLNRLEDFIYGTRETGSVNARVKHILSTILEEENSQTIPTKAANQGNDESPKGDNVPAANYNATQSSTSGNKQAFDYGSYPRVANLEQELLGHTYANDSLSDRLKRLETKAYGAPSSSTDLCQRVDLLDDYAQRHDLYGEHKSVSPPVLAFNSTTPVSNDNVDAQDQSPNPASPWPPSPQQSYSSSASFVGSAEERVSMMEAQLFNHTYPDRPIELRLKKLAKKILPDQDIANLPPTEQTVKLWDTLHPNEKNQVAVLAANPNQSSDTTSDTTANGHSNAKHGSWLHRLAQAGNTFATTGTGPGSSMPVTYGTNTPFYGSGMPGYGNPNSRFIGASVGPGAGPAGLPIGFW